MSHQESRSPGILSPRKNAHPQKNQKGRTKRTPPIHLHNPYHPLPTRSSQKYPRSRPRTRQGHLGGIHSPNAILLAACQGIKRACLHYQTKAGIILSLGRDCSYSTNKQILECAISWHKKKPEIILGIDMAGPKSQKKEFNKNWIEKTSLLFDKAHKNGLKTTYHIGETPHSGWKGVKKVLNTIAPNQIGHGIQLKNTPKREREKILETLSSSKTCIELCPTINLITNSIRSIEELKTFAKDLYQHKIPFAVCTDNPYLIYTNPKKELNLLFPKNSPQKEWAVNCGYQYSFLLNKK